MKNCSNIYSDKYKFILYLTVLAGTMLLGLNPRLYISLKELSEIITVQTENVKANTVLENKTQMTFSPDHFYAYVGFSESDKIDLPGDNIFLFNIDQEYDNNDKVWLEYELKGIENPGVSIIVNDNAAFGGEIIIKNHIWSKNRVRINPEWLNKGENRIQFSKVNNPDIGYIVRGLNISAIRSDIENKELILINDDSYYKYNGNAYISGFINCSASAIDKVTLDGEIIKLNNLAFETLVISNAQNGTIQSHELKLYLKNGSTVSKLIMTEAKQKDVDKIHDMEAVINSEYFISKGEEKTITDQEFSLVMLENTLMDDLDLHVTKLRYKDLPPLEMDLTNVTAGYEGFRFLPHGKHFDGKGAVLKIAYDRNRIPSGYSEADIQTLYFDIEKSKWVPLHRDSIDRKNGFIYSHVTHFTDYINGVIAAPESSEALNFTSTYFNDLIKADPMSGVNLLAPPSASPTGEAGLSYPIEVPPGRNGMQPNLNVTYSSDAGSSWIGYGWNLSIPSIDIETRWGVPRYDRALESEAYLLAGEQLVTFDNGAPYLPHRQSTWIARTTNDRQFYPRVQSPAGFERIIRHGERPDQYYWEVTDRNGIMYYYGGDPVSGLDTNYCVLTSANKNIAKWLLKQVQDQYNNCVLYSYEKTFGGSGSGLMVSIYPDSIQYTMSITQSQAKYYKIKFSTVTRDDKLLDGRTGTLIMDGKKLEQIDISFAGLSGSAYKEDKIKTYKFASSSGPFMKTLLNNIEVLDAGGGNFYSHSFKYFNDVLQGSFEEEGPWLAGDITDIMDAEFVFGVEELIKHEPIGDSERKYSPLGGNFSDGWGGSIYAGVGIPGTDGGKDGTIGASYAYSKATSVGRVQFLDVNGDGLPDKLYRNSTGDLNFRRNNARSGNLPFTMYAVGQSSYSPNTKFDSGVFKFGSSGSLEIAKSIDKTNSYGITAHPSGTSANGGINYQRSISKNLSYLNDINGDGFIDLVHSGKVYFNTMNPYSTTSDVGLSDQLSSLVCSINSPTSIGSNIEIIKPEDQDTFYNEHPPLDVVKMWVAPKKGSVKIPETTVTNIDNVTEITGVVDGVVVRIQHNENPTLLYPTLPEVPIMPGEEITLPELNFDVEKGDIIYFRAMSGIDSTANGENDEIEWDVNIQYQSGDQVLDAFGHNSDSYSFSADAIPNLPGKILVPNIATNVTITADVEINQSISDKVYFEILHGSSIIRIDCAENNGQIQQSFLTSESNEIVTLRLFSNSNIDWRAISVSNRSVVFGTVTQYENDEVPVEYMNFNELTDSGLPSFETTKQDVDNNLLLQSGTLDPYSLIINHNAQTTKPAATGKCVISIKNDFKTFIQQKVNIATDGSGNVTLVPELTYSVNAPITLEDIGQGKIYCTINYLELKDINGEINPSEFLKDWKIEKVEIVVNSNNNFIQHLIPSHFIYNSKEKSLFTSLYRGWGVFAYNPNAKELYDPSNNGLLIVKSALDHGVYTQDASGNVAGPQFFEKAHIPMTYFQYNDHWYISKPKVDNSSIIVTENTSAGTISFNPSRLFEDDAKLKTSLQNSAAGTYPGIETETMEYSVSLAGGVNILSAGDISASGAIGRSVNNIEYLDLNGDRMPDIMGNNKYISYTMPDGEFKEKKVGLKSTYSSNSSIGISIGDNFIHSTSKKDANQAGKNSNTCTLSGSYSLNTSTSKIFWQDINGDGLPDYVEHDSGSNYKIRYNLGYSFSDAISMSIYDGVNISKSKSDGLGLGFSISNGSFSGGLSYNKSSGDGKTAFVDVNGDGLADFLWVDSEDNIQLKLNYGDKFVDYSSYSLTSLGNRINRSQMNGSSINLAFTIFFNCLGFQFAISPGLVLDNKSMNKIETTFADIDGDGYVDFLKSAPPPFILTDLSSWPFKYPNRNEIMVNRSRIGRTNKLHTVSNSIGGTYTLDYAMTPATIQHPNGKWVLQKVIIDDGIAENGPVTTTSFEYDDGYYDRCERTFLGFKSVNILQSEPSGTPYRTSKNQYINDNIYQKGLLTDSEIKEGYNGNVWHTIHNTYIPQLISIIAPTSTNPLPYASSDFSGTLSAEREEMIMTVLDNSSVSDYFTSSGSTSNIGESSSFTYDDVGNVLTYTYNNGSGGYTATLSYFSNPSKNILGLPNDINVGGLRHRSATYLSTGKMQQFVVDPGSNTDFEYDAFGNLVKVTYPDAGGRNFSNYKYEEMLNTYVTSITNSFGHTSSSTDFDYRFGKPTKVTDINGNPITFIYDDAGRIERFISESHGYGARFSYNLNSAPISATTSRDLTSSVGGSTLSSVFFSDGLGRPLRSIVDANVDNGAATSIISGMSVLDAYGRVVLTHYPIGGSGLAYSAILGGKQTSYDYDLLDRKTKEILPGDRPFEYKYSANSTNLQTEIKDANTNISVSMSEYNGPVIYQKSNLGFETKFTYDGINQLKSILHPNGSTSSFTYDLAGRVLTRTSPDAGTTIFNYDGMGNVTQKSDKWKVNYVYDRGRLTKINNSTHGMLNVEFYYDQDNCKNGTGRVGLMKDGSGSQRYNYGPIGEITKIERSIAVPFKADAAEFVTEWKYDLWNRVLHMTYPDGEILDFGYDGGGNLVTVSGTKSSNKYNYVNDIWYDEFGARTKIEYGNKDITSFEYRAEERWSDKISTTFGNSATFEVKYDSYDKMGNIETISKSANGALHKHDFAYDKDYRMENASASWSGSFFEDADNKCSPVITASYNLSHKYDNMGNITYKYSDIKRTDPIYPPPGMATADTFGYEYIATTNKIKKIKESYESVDGINTMVRKSEHNFAYDQNGNTTAEVQNMTDKNNGGTSKEVEAKRNIVWQEDNLLRALSDDNTATHFIYDGNGERVLKISEQWHNVFVNSELSANPHMEPGYTIYVNPYMTVSHDGRYTKHIFAGADRVLSKIGNPKDYGADPTQLALDLPNGKRGTLEGLIEKNCGELGIEDITYESQKPSSPGQDLGLTDENDDYEKLQYYFTKDHLGSSTIVSNIEGKPVQHIEYTAFGESFADWRTETYDTPYRFTGKEQDSETGLYYYGARYYDPRLGRFLSVDPLAEKYGAWSPYVYTMDNPLKYTDPTGMEAEDDYIVNNKGYVINIVKTDKPDRILTENGERIPFLDPKNDEQEMSYYKVGDKLVTFLSSSDVDAIMDKAEAGKHKGNLVENSYGKYDFAYKTLAKSYKNQYLIKEKSSNRSRAEYYKVGGFYIFGDRPKNRLDVRFAYNIHDAGNFLWGNANKRDGHGLQKLLMGADLNELMNFRLFDSSADQVAISQGYKFK